MRTLTDYQLAGLLKEHALWLARHGGKRLDLSHTDLRKNHGRLLRLHDLTKADLTGARLTGLDLTGVCLKDACLKNADLSRACLNGANLTGADLTTAILYRARLRKAQLMEANLLKTHFQQADLNEADLTGALGLKELQFAGANLNYATLPETVMFEGVALASKMIEQSGKLLLALLGAAIYSLFTVAATTDAGLMGNAGTTKLPILGTDVPILYFYFAAPLVLACGYVYFHLTLQPLCTQLDRLPAFFPDGIPMPEKFTPWLLGELARIYSPVLRRFLPLHAVIQYLLGIAIGWLVVPATLIFFWGRYLRKHDSIGSHFHVVLLAATAAFGLIFFLTTLLTLTGRNRRMRFVDSRQAGRFPFVMATYVGVALSAALAGWAVYYPFNAFTNTAFNERPGDGYADVLIPGSGNSWRNWPFRALKFSPYADLTDAEIATKPPGWDGKDITRIKRFNLRSTDLRFAIASRAFLVNTNLQGAKLENASLVSADLRGAVLTDAVAADADFTRADLREANMGTLEFGTDFRRAKFNDAKLDGASFKLVDLRYAEFDNIHQLHQSGKWLSFYGADLTNASFRHADLQAAIMYSADLTRADLLSADLRGANLIHADLRGASLSDVHWEGASIEEAVLIGANFNHRAIQKAIGWQKAHFSPKDRKMLRLPPLTKRAQEELDRGYPWPLKDP